uniref:Uncharacterized protein n=1 Tax=Quercus lobata TaxID=97700 RepID=A0A7N2LFV1_QUELO
MASKASTPPYPSAAKISDSLCYSQYSASLKSLANISLTLGKLPSGFHFVLSFSKLTKIEAFVFFSWNLAFL